MQGIYQLHCFLVTFAKQPLRSIYINNHTNVNFLLCPQLLSKRNNINFVNGTMKTKRPNLLRTRV